MVSIYGSLSLSSVIERGKFSCILSTSKANLSNNRLTQVRLTHTILSREPVLLLSRVGTSLSDEASVSVRRCL